MRHSMGLWIATVLLALALQSSAVLGQSWRYREEYYRRYGRQPYEDIYAPSRPTVLQINPLSSEDMRSGRIVRRCELVPTPQDSGAWTYTWSDESGRIISNDAVLSVQVTGTRPSETFTCEARHSHTGDHLNSNVTIHATNVPVTSETYNTQIEPISPALEFNHPYEARCFISPQPREPVDYVWYFQDRIVSQDQRLRIDNFDRASAGEYVCAARPAGPYGMSGRVYANATLGLKVPISGQEPIEMIPPPGNTLITNLGERRELHCEVEGDNNRGGIRWYLNGTEVDLYSPANRTGHLQRVDYLHVSIMTMNGVEEFHEGQWECRTDYGVKVVNVIVLSDYDVEVNPKLHVLDVGRTLEIHCSAQGGRIVPNTELEWFFRPVGSNQMRPLDYGAGFDRIDDDRSQFTSVIRKTYVTLPDEGEYICREPRGRIGISTLQINRPRTHTLQITPRVIKVRADHSVSVMCYSLQEDRRTRGPQPMLRVFDGRVDLQSTPGAENAVNGYIARAHHEYNGTIIECYSSTPGVEPVTSIIIVEGKCGPRYRLCDNGECLEISRFCDGVRDCADGSDEKPSKCETCDPIEKRCMDFNGRRPLKSTYMAHWQCDGENDCGNDYDETDCQQPDISFCVRQNYRCNNDLMIPRAYVCDAEPDCSGREEEEHCRDPLILDQPQPSYTHRSGETVSLTCEVAGHPNPHVIWRFNWGCLPADRNMVVRNRAEGCGTPQEKTVSTLTISNFRSGDDGIYNCEGLSGMKRAMSRDYTVFYVD